MFLLRSFILILICLFLSGCIAELFLLEEVEFIGARTLMTEGLTEVESLGGTARLARMGVTIEDIQFFSRATSEIRAGRLLSAEQVMFNSEIENIKLIRSNSGKPQLILKGATEPFGEILPNEGKIRLFNNSVIEIRQNLYSIKGTNVKLQVSLETTPGNIISILQEGDLVIKLSKTNNWYRIKILKNGSEMTGYVPLESLIPLFMINLDSIYNNANKTPTDILKEEEKNRWNYYWRNVDARQMTGEDALNLLSEVFSNYVPERKSIYDADKWANNVSLFYMPYNENSPILNQNTFEGPDLKVVAFSHSGELLQFIEKIEIGSKVHNPLDWGPKNYGTWVMVKTIDGKEGWIFDKPIGVEYPFGEIQKRCFHGALTIISLSGNPYDVYINDRFITTLAGYKSYRFNTSGESSYTVHVVQKSGFLFYATDKNYEKHVGCGELVVLNIP
jgi:hypothetical protein